MPSLLGPRLQLLHRQALPGRVRLGFPPLPPALQISSASSAWKGSITQLASFGSRHTHLFPTYGLCPPCMHFGWCELSRLMAFPEHSARGPHCQDPLHPAGLTWPLTTSDFSSPVHLLGVKICTFTPVCVCDGGSEVFLIGNDLSLVEAPGDHSATNSEILAQANQDHCHLPPA